MSDRTNPLDELLEGDQAEYLELSVDWDTLTVYAIATIDKRSDEIGAYDNLDEELATAANEYLATQAGSAEYADARERELAISYPAT
jgi:hypothetical protein